MYYFGMKPMTRDYNQAKLWFDKAAAQEENTAKFYLAGMYRLGMGVPKDIQKAHSIYQKLCNKGKIVACSINKKIEQEGK